MAICQLRQFHKNFARPESGMPWALNNHEKERQKEIPFVRGGDETQHKVTLTKGFYMEVCTVTQGQWQEVMGNNPSHFKGEKNLPVEMVSWNDCQEFIKKSCERDKKPYRLPSEAEWEYACRAGTTTPFFFGQTISTDQANYYGDVVYGNENKGVKRLKTTAVGSFPANAFGLHDMHGNVWQWCQDYFGDYPQNDVVDPQGPEKGIFRIMRGGSWWHYPQFCRSAYRIKYEPGHRSNTLGFRLCFCLEQGQDMPKPPVIDNPKTQEKDKLKPPEPYTNSIGMKFVWIPPGNFVMGSPKEEKERKAEEIQHKVTLTKGFYMGVYTVTQQTTVSSRLSTEMEKLFDYQEPQR